MDLTSLTRSIIRDKEPAPLKALDTPWSQKALVDIPREEYPRPRFVRDSYTCLNGIWGFLITKNDQMPANSSFKGHIRVPFSPESRLSKVDETAQDRHSALPHTLQPDEYLWYYRQVQIPDMPETFGALATGDRQAIPGHLLLHFGAVDQICDVYLGGVKAAHHEGGYLPFTIDITKHLNATGDGHGFRPLDLKVRVTDVTDSSWYARGKQTLRRGGMFYTAQSGIWQSVWMEWVPDVYLNKIIIEPQDDLRKIKIRVFLNKPADVRIRQVPLQGADRPLFEKMVRSDSFYPCDPLEAQTDHPMTSSDTMPIDTRYAYKGKGSVIVKDAILWTPENPYLYDIEIEVNPGAKNSDKVRSYFGVRTFTMETDDEGYKRFCLNHKPYFMKGVLDQGYWPDGLMTPPSDKALIYDIKTMKKLGYNTLRKHVKIEDPRYYYHCDRLGMIVLQDMVSGGTTYDKPLVTYLPNVFPKVFQTLDDSAKSYAFLSRSDAQGRRAFVTEMRNTVAYLKNAVSVGVWVIFNEGWGQFDAATLPGILKFLDSSRPIDAASGWFDQWSGDFLSIHNYFRKVDAPIDEHGRACFLSECGGFTYYVEGHSTSDKSYGYATFKTRHALEENYGEFIHCQILPLEAKGLCGFIYTQVSDVEDEVNGIMTYDRKMVKIRQKIY